MIYITKKIFIVLKAELNKYLLEIKNYYPDHIGNLVTTYIFFMGFFLMLKNNGLKANEVNEVSKAFIGFIIWFFSISVIFEASATISEEKRIGTLEQILIKPAGIIKIILCRSICWTIVSFLEVFILFGFIFFTTNIHINFNINIFPIFIITLIGLHGFGFILAGLTILFTKTASFSSILQYFLLFFTGAIIPTDQLPIILKVISKTLPLTIGIEMSQSLINQNFTMFSLFYDQKFYGLILNSFIYFIIGLTLFKYTLAYSKKNGTMKRY